MSEIIKRTVPFDKNIYSEIDQFPMGRDYDKFNPKINQMIKTLGDMYKKTKIEMKNFFTYKEIEFLVSVFKNEKTTTTISQKIILSEKIKELYALNDSGSVKIDKDTILTKINEITEFQAFTFITMINEYIMYKEEKTIEEIFLTKK